MRARQGLLILLATGIAAAPGLALAHRSGCHTLHTCPSDNNAYQCGDLGYPCNGASRLQDIPPALVNVPLLVDKTFEQVFGRKPTAAESAFWKARYRSDRDGLTKIKATMRWHKEQESTGPKKRPPTKAQLVARINEMFRSVYGREPSVAENKYWIGRVKDKPNEEQLVGAMGYHRAKGVSH